MNLNLIDYLKFIDFPIKHNLPDLVLAIQDASWSKIRDDQKNQLYIGFEDYKSMGVGSYNSFYDETDKEFKTYYENVYKFRVTFNLLIKNVFQSTDAFIVQAILSTLDYSGLKPAIEYLSMSPIKNRTEIQFVPAYIKQRFTWTIFYTVAIMIPIEPIIRVQQVKINLRDAKQRASFTIPLER